MHVSSQLQIDKHCVYMFTKMKIWGLRILTISHTTLTMGEHGVCIIKDNTRSLYRFWYTCGLIFGWKY
jgi:hypothetical protein